MVTICAVAFGWFAMRLRSSHVQRQIVSEYRTGFSGVLYDWEFDAIQDNQKQFNAPGGLLRRLLGDDFFDKVASIAFIGREFTDDDLERIADLDGVRYIYLQATFITKAALMKYLLAHDTIEVVELEDQRELTPEDIEKVKVACPNIVIKQKRVWQIDLRTIYPHGYEINTRKEGSTRDSRTNQDAEARKTAGEANTTRSLVDPWEGSGK